MIKEYDFKCKQCGTVATVDTNDPGLVCCDEPMKRVWGSIGIKFKGSGFYRNDNKASVKVNP